MAKKSKLSSKMAASKKTPPKEAHVKAPLEEAASEETPTAPVAKRVAGCGAPFKECWFFVLFTAVLVACEASSKTGVTAEVRTPGENAAGLGGSAWGVAGASGGMSGGAPAAGAGGIAPGTPEDACPGVPGAPEKSAWFSDAETVLIDTLSPRGVAIDGQDVYYIAVDEKSSLGEIRRGSKSGGQPMTLAKQQDNPLSLLVDDTHIYWLNWSFQGGIMRMTKAPGGSPEPFYKNKPFQIAQDGDFIYWSRLDPPAVGRTAKADGSSTTLADDPSGAPQQVSVYGEWVYWANYVGERIQRVKKTGGKVEVIASKQGYIRGVAADCHGVYWFGGGAFWWHPEGGGPKELASGPLGANGHVFLDRRYMYKLETGLPAEIVRVPRAGGIPESVSLKGSGNTDTLALDDEHVYWSDGYGKKISRTAK